MPDLSTLRVLVVDDMKVMRNIISKGLKKMGFEVIEVAEDGIPAWGLLESKHSEKTPIQLVVSDWNMPGMTGLDLLKKVRSDERFKTLPFIMVTAEGEQASVVSAIKAGVTNYITKPFTNETFEAKLGKVLKTMDAK